VKRYWLILFILGFGLKAQASNGDWQSTWDAVLYAYPERLWRTEKSVLNPDNRLARLADTSFTGEARLNLRLANDRYRISARPILSIRHEKESGESEPQGYLSQWQLRTALTPYWAASIGREVMNWGPAQFRSPSSPFYFDNGRSNPLRELSGVDAIKLAWTPDHRHTLSLAYVEDSGHKHASPDDWKHTLLLKGDMRGDDWAGGLALAQAQGSALFVGIHLQQTLNDACLLYGEIASAKRINALLSPSDLSQPFSLLAVSPRRETGLIGATYTLENGHSLTLEYLHDGHGYSRAESRAYFARAASSLAAAGFALAASPLLLNRNYLHMIWQNNLLDGDDYWRLMMSRNIDDGSTEFTAYIEHAMNGRLTLFLLGSLDSGGSRREFGMVIERSLNLGLRLALP
jgi:hypothetical protein